MDWRTALLPVGIAAAYVLVKALAALIFQAMPDNRLRAFLFKVRWD